MPRSTVAHAYEFQMAGLVGTLVEGHGIDERACVLVELDPAGTVRGVRELERGEGMRAHVDGLANYIMYDPFDAPEYMWLEWRGVSRETAQRLLGEELPAGFPSDWSVMF